MLFDDFSTMTKTVHIIFFFILLFLNNQTYANTHFELISSKKTSEVYNYRYKINLNNKLFKEPEYSFKYETPQSFTSFALGWKTNTNKYRAKDFTLKYSVFQKGTGWTKEKYVHGYYDPSQHQTDIYLTDLLFGHNEFLHDSIRFTVESPGDEQITSFFLILIDVSNTIDTDRFPEHRSILGRSCPEFPEIILRSEWCFYYSECHNPSYSPVELSAPSHIIVHHGGAPDTYTDGYAVVRSYWNYHVNELGWADIGYNYLFDKYGNFFQGRYNPNLPYTDVRAAHAGAANPFSVGINYLGNSDVSLPTQIQHQKAAEFIAWWLVNKDFDPQSADSIFCQDEVWRVIPRICGHRDVNPGGTICPGDALYQDLETLRNKTSQIIEACFTEDSISPQTEIVINRKWQNSDFYVDFNDSDNPGGSGIKYRFLNVSDFDGSEWRANIQAGFFHDNFNNELHQDWNSMSGNWNISNQALIQSDQDNPNTNIYAWIDQNSENIYLYNFRLKISGDLNNKRAGIHFFCSNPQDENRENSYLVLLRSDHDKVQLYKYLDNEMFLMADEEHDIDEGQWYDIKITFNPGSGEIFVYIDNHPALQHIDNEALSEGNSISLRTADCQAKYDELKVFRSRGQNILITASGEQDDMIRYESNSSISPAGKISTLLIDNANNWSEEYSEKVYLDRTEPENYFTLEEEWETENFDLIITDNDNLSGIEHRFLNVADHNGIHPTANFEKGFYYDEMNYSTEFWNDVIGDWVIQDGSLVQLDQSINNTNIYSYLNQNISDVYLYEFNFLIDGSGSNRRAGFHYFCDDPLQSNRGNSYFIWFREATKDIEFYKVTNDVFSLEKHFKADFSVGQWNNVKLVFNRISGKKYVYMNDKLAGEWKDTDPFPENLHHDHSYVSFRSGNSILKVNNFKVFRHRSSQEFISLGQESSMIRYQNTHPDSIAGILSVLVTDSAKNISQVYTNQIKVDITPPSEISHVNDGFGSDLDTTFNYTEISANWSASLDPHSGIKNYYYSVGSVPGAEDIIGRTSSGIDTVFLQSGFDLPENQIYFTSVFAVNGAGLESEISVSNGVLVLRPEQDPSPDCPAEIQACINDNIFELTGATPQGGYYSGEGVQSFVFFNPSSLNPGEYEVTYTLMDRSCTFKIELYDLPQLVCPNDINLQVDDSEIVLHGAFPDGGIYYYNNEAISHFDPASSDTGIHVISYIYTDPASFCQNVCEFNIFVTPSLNVSATDLSANIIVFPNPNDGNFFIKAENIKEKITCKIYDTKGRMISSHILFPGKTNIIEKSSHLAPGIYFLKFITDQKIQNEKILIY